MNRSWNYVRTEEDNHSEYGTPTKEQGGILANGMRTVDPEITMDV